jgi:hypothetical protein
MKIIGYFAIALVSISCLKMGDNSYYVRTTSQIDIKQTDIPATGTVDQVAQIKARAEMPNGCWSKLNFKLTKTADLSYSLEAFGIFESYGSCPDVMVYGDTTIAFKPAVAGKYVFHVYKSATETLSDTMTVAGAI